MRELDGLTGWHREAQRKMAAEEEPFLLTVPGVACDGALLPGASVSLTLLGVLFPFSLRPAAPRESAELSNLSPLLILLCGAPPPCFYFGGKSEKPNAAWFPSPGRGLPRDREESLQEEGAAA